LLVSVQPHGGPLTSASGSGYVPAAENEGGLIQLLRLAGVTHRTTPRVRLNRFNRPPTVLISQQCLLYTANTTSLPNHRATSNNTVIMACTEKNH